ncbi:MAG: hypothetical protein ACREQY_00965, partial [Candidatus Binatia bacterium]
MWSEWKRALRGRVKVFLPSPMKRVFRELERRGIRPDELATLEVFGGAGDWHAIDYVGAVRWLEVWEIKPEFERSLRRNLPGAEIRITNSFEEMKRTPRRYDLIVVDNPASTFGADRSRPGSLAAQGEGVDEHCEHFDLFPDVLRLATRSAVLILNVIPHVTKDARKAHPYVFNPRQLAWRSRLYGTPNPERVPFGRMLSTYERLLAAEGFALEWHFFERRAFSTPAAGRR